MPFELTRESWRTAWPEARQMATAHAAELAVLLQIDEGLMQSANDSGTLHIYGARDDGRLIGYVCWSISRHPEQKGKIMAVQGPWYSIPGTGCGRELYRFALKELAALGVHLAYPHHRWNHRGRDAGKWFIELGAKPLQEVYELDLKELG